MTFSKTTHLPEGSDFRSLFERTAIETGFLLTVEDRLGIELLLRDGATSNAQNPPLLNGLLRHKLRISRGAPEPAPADLVVSGRQVTYMISGGGLRLAVLSMNPEPIPGRVLVASLLGATLIGMRKLQRAPLLRDGGQIETVVVLDVGPVPHHHLA